MAEENLFVQGMPTPEQMNDVSAKAAEAGYIGANVVYDEYTHPSKGIGVTVTVRSAESDKAKRLAGFWKSQLERMGFKTGLD